MNFTSQNEPIPTTTPGDILIQRVNAPEEIEAYTFDSQFGLHASYKSLYTKKESLTQSARKKDAVVVLALCDRSHIMGFTVLAYPKENERWAKLRPAIMMEIQAIEVGRSRRSAGVARMMLEMVMAPPWIEDKIIYMVGYSWTWDLDGSGKSAQAYRKMLINLFEPYGFQEYPTNEPNICLRPENLLMGRVGANVSAEARNGFKWLRFGLGM